MACPTSGEGSSQLTQACAARCTHPGRPRRSSAPHPLSPTGERQRPGSEGHSCPQHGVKPGTEGGARSEPGSWAALGRAKLLLLALPTGSSFCPSCPSMRPQPDTLSCKCSCLTVPHHWGFGPAQQLLPPPLLAAPTSGCCSRLLSNRSSGCWQQHSRSCQHPGTVVTRSCAEQPQALMCCWAVLAAVSVGKWGVS